MNLEELRKRKMALGYTNEQIAQLSGVPLSTVQKIFAGVTQQPRYETLLALERVLDKGTDRVRESLFDYQTGSGTGAAGKKQGEYTLEDIKKLPEDVRAELIDGVLYFMASPNMAHQMILTDIWMELNAHIRKNKGQCITVAAPSDVILHEDSQNLFQPDIYVVCDRSKIRRGGIIGAPDLIVEILSQGTRRKDMVLKLNKYLEGGVREFWMVDPDNKKIIVYIPGEDLEMRIYGFEDRVPVAVFDNQCEVDFRQISERIAFLDELEE